MRRVLAVSSKFDFGRFSLSRLDFDRLVLLSCTSIVSVVFQKSYSFHRSDYNTFLQTRPSLLITWPYYFKIFLWKTVVALSVATTSGDRMDQNNSRQNNIWQHLDLCNLANTLQRRKQPGTIQLNFLKTISILYYKLLVQ